MMETSEARKESIKLFDAFPGSWFLYSDNLKNSSYQ